MTGPDVAWSDILLPLMGTATGCVAIPMAFPIQYAQGCDVVEMPARRDESPRAVHAASPSPFRVADEAVTDSDVPRRLVRAIRDERAAPEARRAQAPHASAG